MPTPQHETFAKAREALVADIKIYEFLRDNVDDAALGDSIVRHRALSSAKAALQTSVAIYRTAAEQFAG